jgi:hypothetical protein
LAAIFHCGHILYKNDVCLVASGASSHKLLTPLVWPFDCNLGLPLSNPNDAILSLCLITDRFGLGCYWKGYIVEYLPSRSTAPSFHDTQQSTWRDVPLGSWHIRTSPALMESIKVSSFTLFWLWYSIMATSCTKMICVWLFGSRHGRIFTNTACLTFRLQFRTTANTLNSWYIVSWYSYRWIWPGVPYLIIHGRIPQFTVVRAVVLWQPTIHLEGRTTGGFTHRDHSNTNKKY